MSLKDELIEEYFKTQIREGDVVGLETHKKDWQSKSSAAEGLLADFRKRVDEVEGKKVLDIGFGNGLIAIAFSKAGAEIYGVEVNQKLLSIAREIAKSENKRIQFEHYDGKKLPFENSFFDYIFCTSVLEHVTHKEELLREMARVLKQGGKVYLAFPNKLALKETHTGLY